MLSFHGASSHQTDPDLRAGRCDCVGVRSTPGPVKRSVHRYGPARRTTRTGILLFVLLNWKRSVGIGLFNDLVGLDLKLYSDICDNKVRTLTLFSYFCPKLYINGINMYQPADARLYFSFI